VAQGGGNGLGGTGQALAASEGGLGGTGIVGVVTGFASICVNGVEVEVDPSMPVDRNGAAEPLSLLEVGQLVVLQASGKGDQLRASRVSVMDAAVGPLTVVDQRSGRFAVMGQSALALERDDLQGLAVGDWVRVSGQRLSSGEVRATRVQRVAPTAQAFTTGTYVATGVMGLAVGGTPLTVTSLPVGLRDGLEVAVAGDWDGARLRVREWRLQPTRQALEGVREVLLQGYVHGLRDRELLLGYEALRLDERVQVFGGDLSSLRMDQSVQVRARFDAQRRLTVERIELRNEGKRGEFVPSATVSRPVANTPTTSIPSGSAASSGSSSGGTSASSAADDSSGRGRGRGRGNGDGDSAESSGSGSGNRGSSNSGSGSDSGGQGRGRGRGGDGSSGSSGSGSSGSGSSGSGSSGSGSSGSGSSGSGSSGSGSSGSGSSGSGSSGSGSSGSGSSGSGSSGSGDSGKGRGRGRGGDD
jgi:hypothetical protein